MNGVVNEVYQRIHAVPHRQGDRGARVFANWASHADGRRLDLVIDIRQTSPPVRWAIRFSRSRLSSNPATAGVPQSSRSIAQLNWAT